MGEGGGVFKVTFCYRAETDKVCIYVYCFFARKKKMMRASFSLLLFKCTCI